MDIERTARLNKDIMQVRSMLTRAETAEEMSRLVGLLIILQREYIEYLEKTLTYSRKVA